MVILTRFSWKKQIRSKVLFRVAKPLELNILQAAGRQLKGTYIVDSSRTAKIEFGFDTSTFDILGRFSNKILVGYIRRNTIHFNFLISIYLKTFLVTSFQKGSEESFQDRCVAITIDSSAAFGTIKCKENGIGFFRTVFKQTNRIFSD